MPTLYDDPMVLKALEMQGTPYNPTLEQNTQLQLDPTLQTLPDIGTPPGEQPPVTQVPAGQDPQMVQQALTLTQTPEEQVPPTGNTPPEVSTPPVAQAPVQTQVPQSTTPGTAASAQEAIRSMEQGAQDMATSAQQKGEATALGYQQEADARKQAIADNDAQIAQQAKQRAEMDKAYSEGMAQVHAANEAAKALPPPADRRSGTQRLMGAIAVGMGAASDGFAKSGGMQQNYAGEIQAQVNTVIERDIQAQREAIANKRADAQGALNEFQLSRQYFSDAQQADQFNRILTTERVNNQLGEIAANTKNKETKAAILGAQAEGKFQVDKLKVDLYKSIMSKKLTPFQVMMMNPSMSSAQALKYANDYNANINAEEGIGSKVRKAENEEGKIDRSRTEAVYKEWVKIAPALEANGRLQKYSTDESIPDDMVVTGKAVKGLKNLFTGGMIDFNSPEATNLTAEIEASRNSFLRLVSGAGITEQEGERQWSEFGLNPNKIQTAKQLKAGIQKLNARTAYYRSVIRASDPEAFDELESRINGAEAQPLGRTKVVGGSGSGKPVRPPPNTPATGIPVYKRGGK